MRNKKIIIIVLLAIALVAWLLIKSSGGASGTGGSAGGSGATPTPTPLSLDKLVLNQEFVDGQNRFSFKYPQGFAVHAYPDENFEMFVIQDEATQEGIQIKITPVEKNTTVMTADSIKKDHPDIAVNEPQEVTIGPAGKGVAFLSNDPAFAGASREVWFVFNKNLYQINTAVKTDELLKMMLNTWQFK